MPGLRPSADAQLRQRLDEVGTAKESHLGLEVPADRELFDLYTESIRVVVEARAVAVIVAAKPGRARSGHVADDVDALEKGEVGVDAEHEVVFGADRVRNV